MDIVKILNSKYPDKEWYLNGDTYEELVWLSNDSNRPTIEELESLWPEVNYEFEYLRIQNERQIAYQKESDPLFFSYQRNEDEVTKQQWLDKIAEIKARYPYPET